MMNGINQLKNKIMERFISHKDLGIVEILMSYQRAENGEELPRVIALARSSKRPYVSSSRHNFGETIFRTSRNSKGEISYHYYLVWGVDSDFRESAFEHLTTKSGRKVTFKSALKTFNDARKATQFVNFSKI
jgi:hypothetical protein